MPASLQDWEAVRGLFDIRPGPVNASLFYLSSHPRPVRDEIARLRERLDGNPLDTVDEGLFGPPEQNLDLRAAASVARYIGARPEEVVLTNSTTHGLGLAYHGLRFDRGDEILLTEHDHYAQHETARLVAERTGATVRRVRLFPGHDASGATVDGLVRSLTSTITPATRVLGITWVHSSSGLKIPLRTVADAVRAANQGRPDAERVLLLVDGVHGLGADEPRVTETGVDIFVSGLHKWMLGPRGTGFVWTRASVWARMRPVLASFASAELYDAWMAGRPPASPVQASYHGLAGFQAYEHVWAIPAAIELHEAIGPARIKARIVALNGRFRDALSRMTHVQLRTPLDPALTAGITTFDVKGLSPAVAVKKLRQAGVIASLTPYRPEYLRMSFGIANSESDVERSITAVSTLG